MDITIFILVGIVLGFILGKLDGLTININHNNEPEPPQEYNKGFLPQDDEIRNYYNGQRSDYE